MKKIIVVALLMILAILVPVMGHAQEVTPRVKIDGNYINFDVPSKNISGRVVVPLRKIFETLGAQVEWLAEKRTVVAVKEYKVIILKIDDTTAKVNGLPVKLDVPAKIYSGRTLVPVRFISESLGCTVGWDNENKTVIIKSNDNSNDEEKIVFKDKNLERTLMGNILKWQGGLTKSEALKITSLEIHDRKITDLSPLVYCKNLTFIHFYNVDISDISALSGLTKLKTLHLHGNQISDVSPLANLTNLEELWLYKNKIRDISPLANLTNLNELLIDKNEITDISGVANMTKLTYLGLGFNQIIDISPLEKLTNLERLDLRENNSIRDTSVLDKLPMINRMSYRFF